MPFPCGGKAAHQGGKVLHGVEPRGRADDDIARGHIRSHARAEGGPVVPLRLPGEVQAVVDGEGRLPREAAGDEQVTHGVRDADVVFDAPEGQDVQDAVGRRSERAAHVIEPVVAVYRAHHGPAAGRAQYGPGEVRAGAVRVDELEALLRYHAPHLAQGGEEAAGADPRLDAELRRFAGEGPAAEADQGDVHAPGEVLEQGVDVGLGPAGVPAADEMYNFQCQAPCYSCVRRGNIVEWPCKYISLL